MSKTITIHDNTWEELHIIRVKERFRSLDEVIRNLLKNRKVD